MSLRHYRSCAVTRWVMAAEIGVPKPACTCKEIRRKVEQKMLGRRRGRR